MDISHEEQQRKEFREILFDLSKSQLSLKDKTERSIIYKRLENLYYSPNEEGRFRHFYSDIFLVLYQIEYDNFEGSIDVLGQNLFEIRKGYQSVNVSNLGVRIDISDSIRKLYDHVSLDIARMRFSDATKWQLTNGRELDKIKSHVNKIDAELSKKAESINNDIATARQAQKSVENELAHQQREYIAILGIFASVVLTFTGGIAFSTSVLNNIAQSSIYRTVCVSLIIGLVLINVLYILFGYVNKLVDKEKTIKSPLIANIVIIAMLILVGIAWLCGCVEKRNSFVDKNYSVSSQVIQESLEESEVTNSDMVSTQ